MSALTITVDNYMVMELFDIIRKKRLTGKLTINFSQGTATGGAQWTEAQTTHNVPVLTGDAERE